MKLSIPQPALAALIAHGGAVVSKKSPLPILNFVRLAASVGSLTLASTDQDRFAQAGASADVDVPGSVCVDGAAFATLIAKHPKSGTVGLELDTNRLIVTCGRSKVKLPTLSAEDFPDWAEQPPESEFRLRADDFKRAFTRVRFAASTDESRYQLQGVHLDYDEGKLHFVATDGHRLAVSGMDAPQGAETCPPAIVPSEAVDAALKVFDSAAEVLVAVNKGAISFAADGLRMSARLIDSTFPDYARIIPARGQPALRFKRADFVDCLDRANVLTGEGAYSAITARPDGEILRLEARNQSGGEASEELAAAADDGFRPFGFNPRYAADFLRTLNVASLTIEQTDPGAGHLVYSDDAPDFAGVLMPMRIAA